VATQQEDHAALPALGAGNRVNDQAEILGCEYVRETGEKGGEGAI
jgi:hypothetical protein